MDEEMLFSLSYEQMTQMAEEEIKQCDFRRDGTHYVWEVNKAHDILRFWYLWRCVDTLAWPQHGSKQTINGLKRSFLRGTRDNDAGKIPTSVAAAAAGADCAGRPRCKTSGAGGDAGY
nr:hypothetical protein [Klebsiella pneumoniae]WGU91837.1 hypothetical protein QIU02_01030 [Klebsiella pneumoniae]